MTSPLIAAEGTFRPMFRLAMPVLAEHLLHVLVEYVDLYLAGNFLTDGTANEAYVAAITQVGYVMWLLFTLFAVVAIGATAMTARFVGAGDYNSASHVTNQALIMGAGFVIVILGIGVFAIDEFVAALQLEGAAARYATTYLLIILPVLPAVMIEEVAIACLRGAGDMVSGLVVMAIVNLVNIVVSASLLLGIGPLPELGWQGLAIGSAVGRATGAVILLVLLFRGRAGLKLNWGQLWPDAKVLRRLLRIGVPGGVDSLSVVCCHLWFISIINQLGTLQTAAHGIGVRIEALAYMPGAAFQMAAATLAGQYLGARDYHRAGRSVVMACVAAGCVMCSAGALFFFASVPLSQFFVGSGESAVVPLAARLLRIVSVTMLPLSLTMVLSGALRGAGDTRWPLVFTFVGFLGLRIPLAYLLAHDSLRLLGSDWVVRGLGWGVEGAWYAMVADVSLRCVLVLLRFRHGGWKRIEV